MAVGVCASEALAVGGEFTVEHGSMALALNLDGLVRDRHKVYRKTGKTSGKHLKEMTVKDLHQYDPFDREFAIKP